MSEEINQKIDYQAKIKEAELALVDFDYEASRRTRNLEFENQKRTRELERELSRSRMHLEFDISRLKRDQKWEQRMREIADESSQRLAAQLTNFIKGIYGG